MIDLAYVLDVEAIAEGVETVEQAAQLRNLGCPLAQGYSFSMPLRAEVAGTLLTSCRALGSDL